MRLLRALFSHISLVAKIIITSLIVVGCSFGTNNQQITLHENPSSEPSNISAHIKKLSPHPLVEAVRKQIGVVTSYDTSYYQGGHPPADRGACTDVIARALLENGYDIKATIDADMEANPARYPTESDPNINFRRVRNVKYSSIIM